MATSRLQMEGDDSVLVHITHSNLKSFAADVRFSPQMNVEEKLWKKCGTSVNAIALELYDESGSKVAALSDDTRDLSVSTPLLMGKNGDNLTRFRLYIVDLDPSSVTTGGWLEDTSLVEKCNISEEDYAKRTDSFRKFKEKRVSQNPVASEVKTKEDFMEDLCANIKVGDRCQVEPGEKRGVGKYVGKAEPLGPGYWVGIQYDEPLGKNTMACMSKSIAI
ncbi:Ubiquitin-like domain-containing protein [Hirschfeldia incana]|nr:Ubiquitin-like domain-containing protein [Hirschfeldia incana]